MDGYTDKSRMTDTGERVFTDTELETLSNDSLWSVYRANCYITERLDTAMRAWNVLHFRGQCPRTPPISI